MLSSRSSIKLNVIKKIKNIRKLSTEYFVKFGSQSHQVTNQVPLFENYNQYEDDKALKEAVEVHGGKWIEGHIHEFGKRLGSPKIINLGYEANMNPPKFRPYDKVGNRINSVDFHPSYHVLMRLGIEALVTSFVWNNQDKRGSHVGRAALIYLLNQVDCGVNCPLTMTFSSFPVLKQQSDVTDLWMDKIKSAEYDPRDIPISEKKGVTIGMSMTEKQGGSDVRSNTTFAKPVNPGKTGPGEAYVLMGHKWFTSAPMSDGFLTLAKTENNTISCFLIPRWLPVGDRNTGFVVQRLKDKLGDRSNASSEVEYHHAWGQMIGEEGKGVKTILEMVAHTRLDCSIGSSAISRLSVASAANHVLHRYAFGNLLYKQPLMANVLSDLIVECEAMTTLAMRTARAFDDALFDKKKMPLQRILAAVSKYWICKRSPSIIYEAMECHGGNGYVEDFILARLYRQAPLNSIWEGSGNVICLDVLRSCKKEPETIALFFEELALAKGLDPRLDSYIKELKKMLSSDPETLEIRARTFVDRLAIAMQASLLVQQGDPAVAEAFCSTRLTGNWSNTFGTLPPSTDFTALLNRILPSKRP